MFQFYSSSIKTTSPASLIICVTEFQFYSSSIKTFGFSLNPAHALMFQFYSSSIKTREILGRKAPSFSFNSIVVRLRQGRYRLAVLAS